MQTVAQDRAALAEALTNMARAASRQPRAVGSGDYKTPMDRAHEQINEHLTLWELAE